LAYIYGRSAPQTIQISIQNSPSTNSEDFLQDRAARYPRVSLVFGVEDVGADPTAHRDPFEARPDLLDAST
jgi:hypothetical protein